MVGYTEITVALNSLKAARDIVSGMTAMRDAVMVAELRISLQSTILDAQQSLMQAQERQAADAKRIADLEEEVAAMKDWERERERYSLQEAGFSSYVYALDFSVPRTGPAHWLCANCFADRKKSILQPVSPSEIETRIWACNRCGQKLTLFHPDRPR